MGLRFKEQKGPTRVPHPWSQRSGDLTWGPIRLPGLEWVRQMPSARLSSSGLGGPLPPTSPDLSRLPPMPPGPTRPGWGFGMGGTGLGAQQALRPKWVRRSIALHSSPALPGESLPSPSPDLPSLRGADLVWLPLLLPLQSPNVLPVHSMSYQFTLWFLPSPWGSEFPTSGRQAP